MNSNPPKLYFTKHNTAYIDGNSETHLSVWGDLPSLVISLFPLPENNSGAIMDATMLLLTIKSIPIQANIIDHPYSSVTVTQVLALGPQYRFIKNIWIVRFQLQRMSISNGVLQGQPGSFINQSKGGKALCIFHSSAEPLISVPMLEVI